MCLVFFHVVASGNGDLQSARGVRVSGTPPLGRGGRGRRAGRGEREGGLNACLPGQCDELPFRVVDASRYQRFMHARRH